MIMVLVLFYDFLFHQLNSFNIHSKPVNDLQKCKTSRKARTHLPPCSAAEYLIMMDQSCLLGYTCVSMKECVWVMSGAPSGERSSCPLDPGLS